MGPEGKYEWVKEGYLYKYVTNHFENLKRFKDDVKIINNYDGQIIFEEIKQYSEKF